MRNTENLLQNSPAATPLRQQQLNRLLARPDIWRASGGYRYQYSGISSGHPALDALLSGHGWPRGATTELLLDRPGIGEISLLLPSLANITRKEQLVVLVNPPFIPYAPALANAGVQLEKVLILHPRGQKDELWAVEQSLLSGCCGALLNWQGQQVPADKDLRRLQLAAREGNNLHFHFRPRSVAVHPSPARLRLQLGSDGEQIAIQLLKQPGGRSGQRLHLTRNADLTRRDHPLH